MDSVKRKLTSEDAVAKKVKADVTGDSLNYVPSDDISLSTKNKVEDEEEDVNKLEICNNTTGHLKKKSKKIKEPKPKIKKPGFSDECYNETTYYFENGLRKVYPYYFTFTTYTKGRWVGEKVLDVFAREFRAHSAEVYKRCIKAGTLTVNHETVETDYRLKHNDLLSNIVHRHEVPVTSEPIGIIHLDNDLLVVNKPASIPVHPCGRYRHNTVVFILAKEYNLKNLRTIHRLDRLTSGILLFGRTLQKASLLEHQLRNRDVQKEYVCRVEGEFPDEEVNCKEPIEVVSYKIGVCKVSPNGKPCSTIFRKQGFNGESSIVSCKPHTGRMHQIRVHLQYLGFPIVNDPLYNHSVFGPERGKGGRIGKSDEELIKDLITIHNAESWLGIDGDLELDILNTGNETMKSEPGSENYEKDLCCEKISIPVEPQGEKNDSTTETKNSDCVFDPKKITKDEHCYECKVQYRDPKPTDLVMYLHAWKYKGPDWSYETELPEWAKPDWKEEKR